MGVSKKYVREKTSRDTFETEKKETYRERREKEREWSNFTGGAGQRLINSYLSPPKFISSGLSFLREISSAIFGSCFSLVKGEMTVSWFNSFLLSIHSVWLLGKQGKK